jgi:hypothetical protein
MVCARLPFVAKVAPWDSGAKNVEARKLAFVLAARLLLLTISTFHQEV